MSSIQLTFDKEVIISILSSRKMTLENLNNFADINDSSVVFHSHQSLVNFSNSSALPLSIFFNDADDLDDGVKIARKNDTFSRDETRDDVHYYTYHHLVTTKTDPDLMALRLDLHSNNTQPLKLNSGHKTKEVVYVTRGKVRIQWLDENNQLNEDILNEGDSIFITPFVPHSFTNFDKNLKSEIIAINYV